jgi:electron transfer flavoprotein beta subunit
MRIVACFKVSPETQDVSVRADRTLDLSRAKDKIGAYDLNAIEAARQLADQAGGEVVGLTVGEPEALANSKVRKDALSRGLDRLVTVPVAGASGLDSFQTASALAQALAAQGAYDLVLLGAGSSDQYSQQVGNQLGALLGVPTLNGVDQVTLQYAAQGAAVTVERVLEDSAQVVEVALPAVLTVTSGINTPRLAGMRDILAAGKKPVDESSAEPPAPATRPLTTLAPEQADRAHLVIEADPAAAAGQLAEYLKTT